MAPPILLLTRPLESAHAFAASLDPAALAGVRVVIAPLMGIVGTGARLLCRREDHAERAGTWMAGATARGYCA